jgi:hypothetical protein
VNPRSIRFSEFYVSGFLNGGSYEAIQLEVNANMLEGRGLVVVGKASVSMARCPHGDS